MTEKYEICFEIKNLELYVFNNVFSIFLSIFYWLLDSVYHFDHSEVL